jgi:hypothetical protein
MLCFLQWSWVIAIDVRFAGSKYSFSSDWVNDVNNILQGFLGA